MADGTDESPKDGGGNASYYELPPNCSRIQDVIVESKMTWNQANIFKAAYRWEKKPDLVYNLEKIIFFAQDELDRIYGCDSNNPRSSEYESK